MIRKVRMLVRVFVGTVIAAALASAVGFVADFDWSQLGIYGPAIGAAAAAGLQALVAYNTKDTADDVKGALPEAEVYENESR